jgi:hypothetical protein
VARWNEATDVDASTCLAKALAMKPDLAPLPDTVPPSLRAAVAERCGETIEQDDLLV